MDEHKGFGAIIGMVTKAVTLKSHATPKQEDILKAAIIMAKVAAANAAKQMDADLDAVLAVMASELNDTAKKIFMEEE